MSRWDYLPQETIEYIMWLRRQIQWRFRVDRLIRRLLRSFGFGVQRLTDLLTPNDEETEHPGPLGDNDDWLSPNLSQYMHFMHFM
jgi:hypothetical protein